MMQLGALNLGLTSCSKPERRSGLEFPTLQERSIKTLS